MTQETLEEPDPVLALLLENKRDFLRFLERRVGSRETAEDVFQEAFARALARRESLRDEESAVAWFYRMLRNSVIDLYRHNDAAKRALEAFGEELAREKAGTELHGAICACVSGLATTLKPEYAAALQEVEVEGLPLKVHAERHGITTGNAAVRVHRARQALKKQVIASCGACATHGCLDCDCRHPTPMAE